MVAIWSCLVLFCSLANTQLISNIVWSWSRSGKHLFSNKWALSSRWSELCTCVHTTIHAHMPLYAPFLCFSDTWTRCKSEKKTALNRYLDLKWHFMCAQENSREYNYNPYLYFVSSICNTLNVRFLIPRLRQHAPYNLYLENGKIFICSFFFNIHKERAQYVVVWICLRLLASFVYKRIYSIIFLCQFWPIGFGVVVRVAWKFIIINTTSGAYIKFISYGFWVLV